MSEVTIKKPTILDLARLFETQKKSPEEISITCVRETRSSTLHEVIGHERTDQILQQLKNIDPFTQLPGVIIVRQSQKA